MNNKPLFANTLAVCSLFRFPKVEKNQFILLHCLRKIVSVISVTVGEKHISFCYMSVLQFTCIWSHLLPPDTRCCGVLHTLCVCVCVCVCVLFVPLSTWRLFKARGRKSGVGRLVGACGEISRSKLVLSGGCRRGEDGHSCPGVFSHQEDAAGRPGSEGDAHSQLHAAGRHCWRSFVLGIVVRSRGVLLCLKCVQNVSNREHCSEVGRVILEVN